jgi:hypothetical protein
MPSRSSGVTESWSRFRTVIVRDGVYGRAVKETETSGELTVRSLAPESRDAFASLAERDNGVWAGAGARGSIGAVGEKKLTADGNRDSRSGWSRRVGARAALVVEAYPQDTAGRQITASFLYNATPSLFEEAGFSYPRPKERTLRYDRHGRADRALKGI